LRIYKSKSSYREAHEAIRVVKYALIINSKRQEGVWYWSYDGYQLYYDIGEEVRMKVIESNYKTSNELSSMFTNANPINMTKQENIDAIIAQDNIKENVTIDMVMNILCSMAQEGLGPLQWWK
jgi:DNA-directed RNA polymerase subunit E'/Rpb7